jgi:hypothetical protein
VFLEKLSELVITNFRNKGSLAPQARKTDHRVASRATRHAQGLVESRKELFHLRPIHHVHATLLHTLGFNPGIVHIRQNIDQGSAHTKNFFIINLHGAAQTLPRLH